MSQECRKVLLFLLGASFYYNNSISWSEDAEFQDQRPTCAILHFLELRFLVSEPHTPFRQFDFREYYNSILK